MAKTSESKTNKMHHQFIKIVIAVTILLFNSNISALTHEDKNKGDKNQIPRPVLASMTWSQEKGFDLVVDKISTSVDTVGWVNFTNAINQTGWSYLEIKTHEEFADKIQVRTQKFFDS